jgi:hypothetical protein
MLAILIAAALAVVVFGSGVGALVHYRLDRAATCMNQGATLVTHQGPAGECVGVSDGSYRFVQQYAPLARIEKLIKIENERVTAHGAPPYVSVAYLLPISATGGVQAIQTVAEQLEGAYTAQVYANTGHVVGGTTPNIQLLIASSGTQGTQWRTAVRYIENDVTSQHLLAVAGLGVSLNTTFSAVEALTKENIPVIGSSITSDVFDNIKNLVRIPPSNLQEVAAALSFIKPRAATAFLIEDINRSDSYDRTLVDEFRHSFPDPTHKLVAEETYDTTGDRSSTGPVAAEVANRLAQMTSDICSAHDDVVLFAGRGRDLASLLGDFPGRPCLDRRITIVTGDDVTDMPITARVRAGLNSGVDLYYAGNANPQEWTRGTGAAIVAGRNAFNLFKSNFTHTFSAGLLSDGNAMMGYDGMLTTIKAIRLAPSRARVPRSVADELGALQGNHEVPGASGLIVLPTNYEPHGTGSNPVGKAVPILQLEPTGTIRFVQLDWPDGKPPVFS